MPAPGPRSGSSSIRPGPSRRRSSYARSWPAGRQLAESLGLAVNTVAKVYRRLEADGVVVTEGRRGTFVAGSAVGGEPEARAAADAYAARARALGLTLAEAEKLLRQAW